LPKHHNELFGRIAGFQPLLAATRKAIRGKRKKGVPTAFMDNLEREVLRLERQLTTRWPPKKRRGRERRHLPRRRLQADQGWRHQP
jgi:hypothetical protein